MSVKWEKSKSGILDILLKEIPMRYKDNQGHLVSSTFFHRVHSEVLYNMLDFSSDIIEDDAKEIVNKVLRDLLKQNNLTSKSFLEEVNRLEREHLAQPIRRYIFATEISISPSVLPAKIRSNGVYIVFEKDFPEHITRARKGVLKDLNRSLFSGQMPHNYAKVRVHVSAVSVHEAERKAYDMLSFTSGVWNWIFFQGSLRKTYGASQPVNKIVLGPVHTLHLQPSGKSATNIFWYEPSYLRPVSPFKHDKVKNYYDSLKYVQSKLKNHNYADSMKKVFIAYSEALNETLWNTSYHKLWNILEWMTTPERVNHQKTIERVAFLFKNRDYHYQILQFLRDMRNSLVHRDPTDNIQEETLFQLKIYVDALIKFHLEHGKQFLSLEYAVSFLDHSHEKAQIESQIKDLQEALKFLSQ